MSLGENGKNVDLNPSNKVSASNRPLLKCYYSMHLGPSPRLNSIYTSGLYDGSSRKSSSIHIQDCLVLIFCFQEFRRIRLSNPNCHFREISPWTTSLLLVRSTKQQNNKILSWMRGYFSLSLCSYFTVLMGDKCRNSCCSNLSKHATYNVAESLRAEIKVAN